MLRKNVKLLYLCQSKRSPALSLAVAGRRSLCCRWLAGSSWWYSVGYWSALFRLDLQRSASCSPQNLHSNSKFWHDAGLGIFQKLGDKSYQALYISETVNAFYFLFFLSHWVTTDLHAKPKWPTGFQSVSLSLSGSLRGYYSISPPHMFPTSSGSHPFAFYNGLFVASLTFVPLFISSFRTGAGGSDSLSTTRTNSSASQKRY